DILDCRCARRSARRQVGTKGWSFPIEQRDTAIDLKTHQHPLYRINLLNLTHTTADRHYALDLCARPDPGTARPNGTPAARPLKSRRRASTGRYRKPPAATAAELGRCRSS